jgi:hypothetical protein
VTTLADVRDLRPGPIRRHQVGRLGQHFVPLVSVSQRPA